MLEKSLGKMKQAGLMAVKHAHVQRGMNTQRRTHPARVEGQLINSVHSKALAGLMTTKLSGAQQALHPS